MLSFSNQAFKHISRKKKEKKKKKTVLKRHKKDSLGSFILFYAEAVE